MKIPGVLLVITAAILWGTAGIVAKAILGQSTLSPVGLGCLRLAISTPGLLLYGLATQGRGFLRIDPALNKPALAMIAVGIAAYQAFFYGAVILAGVTLSTLVSLCLSPLLVVILSRPVFGERLDGRVLLAVVLALGGTGLLVGWPGSGAASGAGGSSLLWGVLLACGAALSYASLTIAGRIVARHMGGAAVVVLSFSGGAVLLLPVAVMQGISLDVTASTWGLLLYLGLVPTALAYALLFRGMKSTTATTASLASLCEPLTATVLATVFFGERLGLWGMVGAGLLLLGLLLASLRPRPL